MNARIELTAPMDVTADGRPLADTAARERVHPKRSAAPPRGSRLDAEAKAEPGAATLEAVDASMRRLEFLLATAAILVAILLGITR